MLATRASSGKRGETAGWQDEPATQESDVYAFGVVLYELAAPKGMETWKGGDWRSSTSLMAKRVKEGTLRPSDEHKLGAIVHAKYAALVRCCGGEVSMVLIRYQSKLTQNLLEQRCCPCFL